jgi:hypothetical protein
LDETIAGIVRYKNTLVLKEDKRFSTGGESILPDVAGWSIVD